MGLANTRYIAKIRVCRLYLRFEEISEIPCLLSLVELQVFVGPVNPADLRRIVEFLGKTREVVVYDQNALSD